MVPRSRITLPNRNARCSASSWTAPRAQWRYTVAATILTGPVKLPMANTIWNTISNRDQLCQIIDYSVNSHSLSRIHSQLEHATIRKQDYCALYLSTLFRASRLSAALSEKPIEFSLSPPFTQRLSGLKVGWKENNLLIIKWINNENIASK